MSLPITFHPGRGAILICDDGHGSGFQPPEMVKARPVVVISARRRASPIVTVVPLSSSAPPQAEPWHHLLSTVAYPPARGPMWAKCDMVAAVAIARHDRVKHAGRYQPMQMPSADLAAIIAGVRAALGIDRGVYCPTRQHRGGPAMSAETTRRSLFGASAGLLLLAAPAAANAATASQLDGRLIDLEAALHARDAVASSVAGAAGDDYSARLDGALDEFWEVADEIAKTPARSLEGLQCKARVLPVVIENVGGDDGHLGEHLHSLLRDILGEA